MPLILDSYKAMMSAKCTQGVSADGICSVSNARLL